MARNNGTMLYDIYDLARRIKDNEWPSTTLPTMESTHPGYWPARPMGWTDYPHRIKYAWMVFTGKADVIVWKGQ